MEIPFADKLDNHACVDVRICLRLWWKILFTDKIDDVVFPQIKIADISS